MCRWWHGGLVVANFFRVFFLFSIIFLGIALTFIISKVSCHLYFVLNFIFIFLITIYFVLSHFFNFIYWHLTSFIFISNLVLIFLLLFLPIFFLIDIFFNFIHQHLDSFYFYLIFIYYYFDCYLFCFFLSFLSIFFNFTPRYFIDWGFGSMIFLSLFSMGLVQTSWPRSCI